MQSSKTKICGATVRGNLQVQADIVGAQIGAPYSSCSGNTINGNLTLQLLAGSISAVGNTVSGRVTVRDKLASTTIQSNGVTRNLENLQNLGATQVVNNTVGGTLDRASVRLLMKCTCRLSRLSCALRRGHNS